MHVKYLVRMKALISSDREKIVDKDEIRKRAIDTMQRVLDRSIEDYDNYGLYTDTFTFSAPGAGGNWVNRIPGLSIQATDMESLSSWMSSASVLSMDQNRISANLYTQRTGRESIKSIEKAISLLKERIRDVNSDRLAEFAGRVFSMLDMFADDERFDGFFKISNQEALKSYYGGQGRRDGTANFVFDPKEATASIFVKMKPYKVIANGLLINFPDSWIRIQFQDSGSGDLPNLNFTVFGEITSRRIVMFRHFFINGQTICFGNAQDNYNKLVSVRDYAGQATLLLILLRTFVAGNAVYNSPESMQQYQPGMTILEAPIRLADIFHRPSFEVDISLAVNDEIARVEETHSA